MKRQIIVIAHNIRSSHNVGSLLRTCDGLSIECVYLTGYTPYPAAENDTRMPHIARKVDKEISKTALDAQKHQKWQHFEQIEPLLEELRNASFTIAALEQTKSSVALPEFKPPEKIAIILGNEVTGVEQELLQKVNLTLEIPMTGKKESFNVVQAAAMALYHCRFTVVE